jgi:hypothetical protein
MLHFFFIVMTVLRFAGVIIIFAGVALFGVHFIRGNGRSTDGKVPRSAWLGPGPKKAMRFVAVGAALLASAYVISLFMPDGS